MPTEDNYNSNTMEFYEDDGAALGETGEKVILKMREDGTHYEVKTIHTIGTGTYNEGSFFTPEEF
jgi:hypothetical protein